MVSSSKLHVHIKRKFDLLSFIPPSGELPYYMPRHLYRWIHNRAYKGLLSSHKCAPDVVCEFYFRGSHSVSNSYNKPKDSIVAKVRRMSVVISSREIRDLYSCLEIDLSLLSFKSADEIVMDDIFSLVTGDELIWGSLMYIPQGFLSLDQRVLVKIYHHCVRHEHHKSMVTKAYLYFVYSVGAGKDADLAQVLFNEILSYLSQFKSGKIKSLALILGSLIFRILEKQ